MKQFASKHPGSTVYCEYHEIPSTADIIAKLKAAGVHQVALVDPDDDWLLSRLSTACKGKVDLTLVPHPHFLTTRAEIDVYKPKREFYFFHDFYIKQRKALNILVVNGKPEGSKWSFDADNRARLPESMTPPPLLRARVDSFVDEAMTYVERHFPSNPGGLSEYNYPIDRAGALRAMKEFFAKRYQSFGDFEDAISVKFVHNFHSVLTPFLNIGLLSPAEIVAEALKVDVPLNSKEGFIRQIIGWREFVRLVYLRVGRRQRTRNFLQNSRDLPNAFYSADTKIGPVDLVIRRVINHAYCHHIERLMVLGNFMLLCEIHPDHVYKWFMEMFIDAYDWVMVPNVYGMSQYADGGLMTTKPYISGSSYILKMSDFKKGEWAPVWDALYWRFMHKHREMVRANPRLSVMAGMCDKLEASGKLKEHLKRADGYLEELYA